MQKQGWIKPDQENFELTARGEKQFSDFGIDTEPVNGLRKILKKTKQDVCFILPKLV